MTRVRRMDGVVGEVPTRWSAERRFACGANRQPFTHRGGIPVAANRSDRSQCLLVGYSEPSGSYRRAAEWSTLASSLPAGTWALRPHRGARPRASAFRVDLAGLPPGAQLRLQPRGHAVEQLGVGAVRVRVPVAGRPGHEREPLGDQPSRVVAR
jgi:hypothetical protein